MARLGGGHTNSVDGSIVCYLSVGGMHSSLPVDGHEEQPLLAFARHPRA